MLASPIYGPLSIFFPGSINISNRNNHLHSWNTCWTSEQMVQHFNMKSSISISKDQALEDVEEDEDGEVNIVPHVSSSKSACQSFQETYRRGLDLSENTKCKRIYHDYQRFAKDGLCQILVPQESEARGDVRAILCGQDDNYFVRVKQLQTYLDKVESLVKPGCSPEVLDVALESISVIVDSLSRLSSTSRLQASL